jgi:hypothetical protein
VFTPQELEMLDDAIAGYRDLAEGPILDPVAVRALDALTTKIYCLRKIGHTVAFMYEGVRITGRVQEYRDGLVYAVSKGFIYRLEPGEILRED